MVTEQATLTLVHVNCCVCGTVFGMEKSLHNNRKNYGGDMYCPNGHSLSYCDTTVKQLEREKARLTARLDQKEAEIRMQREQRLATERRLNATRGVVTRTKNRIAAGVCPCCNRTFQDLARHMAGKHPRLRGTEGRRMSEIKLSERQV